MITIVLLLMISSFHSKLIKLLPNIPIPNFNIKLNEEVLFKVSTDDLKPNRHYKILLHYLGSIGVDAEINLICQDFLKLDRSLSNDIELNDLNDFDFQTNSSNTPTFCGKETKVFLISLIIKPVAYYIREVLEVDIAVELTESKFNTSSKVVNILTNKNLYFVLLVVMIVLPLLLYLMRYKIKEIIIYLFMLDTIEKIN